MAKPEIDVITHLLNVEQNAFILAKDAQERANRILSDARAKADKEFDEQYKKISSTLEKDFESKKEEIASAHKKKFDEYVSSVKEVVQDTDAFKDFVKKTLGVV
jgi:hypothetical protein